MITFIAQCQVADVVPNYNSKSDEMEALVDLRDVLINGTGNPYMYIDSIDLSNAFDSIALIIEDDMSRLQRYRLYASLVALIHDGHTNLLPKTQLMLDFYKRRRNPPFAVTCIQEHLYITEGFQDEEETPPGEEILEVNGRTIPKIVEIMAMYYTADGFNKTLISRLNRKMFWFFYYLWVEADIKVFHLKIKALDGTVYEKDFKRSPITISKDDFNSESALLKPRKVGYPSLAVDQEKGFGLLKIGTFINPNQSKYESIILDHMKDIRESGITKLIVDLRDNMGGRFEPYILGIFIDTIVVAMESDLKSVKNVTKTKGLINKAGGYYKSYKDHVKEIEELRSKGIDLHQYDLAYSVLISEDFRFTGDLVVLVNGYTFSAAAVLASQLKYYANATVIGEETGGSYYHGNSGQLEYRFKFFRHKLNLNPYYFKTGVPKFQDYEGGLLPDIEVEEKYSTDENYDPYLDAALEYFKNL